MGHDYVRQFRSKHVDVELADPVPMLVYLGPWLYMIGAPSVQRVQYRALTQCELALSAESGVNNDLVQVNHTNFLPALRIYPGNCSSIKLHRSRVSIPNS